eukprot:gene15552-biopygen670
MRLFTGTITGNFTGTITGTITGTSTGKCDHGQSRSRAQSRAKSRANHGHNNGQCNHGKREISQPLLGRCGAGLARICADSGQNLGMNVRAGSGFWADPGQIV